MTRNVTTPKRTTLSPPGSMLALDPASVKRASETFPLRLFHAAAKRVPAYKNFLKKHGIVPAKIRTREDFRHVPFLDKKNYISQYPMEQLCWDGTLDGKKLVYTATSGSTGIPYYFPRDASLEYRIALLLEPYLRSTSQGKVPTTLTIVSFGMGVWIGGLIVYQAFRLLGEWGYPVAVIAPGTNKKEIFEALVKVAPKYDQVLLCGYPPFIKDVLDEAVDRGFDPKKCPLKLLFAAEAFSETFRDYVTKKAGAREPVLDTANIYGSAELGAMAIETPVAIALRRSALKDPKLYGALFSEAAKLPTLAQFHPAIVDFEEHDGSLLLTGDNALPLIRYAIGDRGGVRTYDEAIGAAELSDPGLVRPSPLPFVYVYERSDFSTKLYGAIIYAEHVRAGLQARHLERTITGKFSMATRHDARENEYLEINVELKPRTPATVTLCRLVCEAIVTALREKNAEYADASKGSTNKVTPKIMLWSHEHPEHFRPGGKQQWINKR